MARPKGKHSRQQITTTFREDLLNSVDSLAYELGTSRNVILETAYQYLICELSRTGIENKLKEYKEDK